MQKATVTRKQQNLHTRNAQRIAALLEVRKAKHVARINARNQAAYLLAAQQLAAQFGIDPHAMLKVQVGAARANSGTAAPSTEAIVVNGVPLKPCKAVHALCATLPATATRAEQIALCVSKGVNKATASTQVGVYRKATAAQ